MMKNTDFCVVDTPERNRGFKEWGDRVIKHLTMRRFPFYWQARLSKMILGKTTNFKRPRDLNEKIQWMMFYSDTSQWTMLADKYRVRRFVEDRIGAEYLVPLLGKWENADDIDFDSLPVQFVMKPNNGSYDTEIVRDKGATDIEAIRSRMSKSLENPFGFSTAEIHYTRIRPCIVAEALLECDTPGGLIDYKIWCFGGKPHCVFVCANRDNVHHTTDFVYYDLDWNKHDENISEPYRNNFCCPRPLNLDKMLGLASRLSEGLPQVRVDFYNINGDIYFGEMTLTSNFGMMGYFTQKTLDDMGDLVALPRQSIATRVTTWCRRNLPRL